MGKAGKGTAWAEYKLESVLTVPSLISESIIMEDDDEGSTPGSTPAKGSPRQSITDEDWQDDVRKAGRDMLTSLETVRRLLVPPLGLALHGLTEKAAVLRRWVRATASNCQRPSQPQRSRQLL